MQGEISTNSSAEAVFADTHVPSITFIRCVYFMENWASCADTLQAPEPFFFSTITPLDWSLPMVAVRDIGSVAAREVVSGMKTSSEAPYIYELHGPQEYSPKDVQAALSHITGKNVTVKGVESHQLLDFFKKVFVPKVAEAYDEMTRGILPGGKLIVEPDPVEREIVRGKTSLEEALRDLVKGSG